MASDCALDISNRDHTKQFDFRSRAELLVTDTLEYVKEKKEVSSKY